MIGFRRRKTVLALRESQLFSIDIYFRRANDSELHALAGAALQNHYFHAVADDQRFPEPAPHDQHAAAISGLATR